MSGRGLGAAARFAWSFLAAVSLSLAAALGPLPPTPIAFGSATSGVTFDGSASWVQMPASQSLLVTSNLTLEAWARPTSVVTGLNGVVSKPGFALALQPVDTGFAVVLLITSGGKTVTATTAPAGPLGLGQWYHLAGTFDGQTLRVFVNGNQLASLAQTGTIDTALQTPLRVGMLDGSSIHFAGEIDEVRVSDTVRYTGPFKPAATPFVADTNTRGLWHFDEGTGITAQDASGNANTGTLMGGVAWATDSPVGSVITPPLITNVATTVVESGTATITWTTDRAASSQVEYGPTAALGSHSPADLSLVTSHRVKLDGLLGRTPYTYRVVSTDAFGNLVPSTNFSFTTTDPSASLLGEWSAAMNWPEVAVHAALLYTGDVIAWDAFESPGTPSVRLWHPSSETFTSVPNLTSQIFCSGMATLADGRLLVVGGHNGQETGITDSNIFDPRTSTWTAAPRMAEARWYPSATELPDGRVLAFSGQMTPGVYSNRPEIYTPSTNSWSSLAVDTSDFKTNQYPLSYQLPNGKFFTIGASNGIGRYLDVAAQAYTPALPNSTLVLNGSAVMYRPGKILFSGGGHTVTSENAAEVVDLTQVTPAWRSTQPMAMARAFHTMLVLPDGKVLTIGGGDRVDAVAGGTSQLSAESWDPATETWTTLAAERDPRQYHSTALLLPDGRVLVAGGGHFGANPDFYSAEIYSPPYLFKGNRPTITSAPATATYAANMTIGTPDASNITSVVLTGLGAVTHTLDADQRYVELGFSTNAGGLAVQAPQTASLTPPGYYMLWLVNSSGVPSVARIVQLGGAPATVVPPVVSLGTPTSGANVFGPSTVVTALATSSVGINQVQLYLDDQPLGAPLTKAPYVISWDTTHIPNGSHQLAAKATDIYGDLGTSASITVNVLNIPPAVMSQVGASNVTQTGAVINWTTDEPSIGAVQFGTSASFGSTTPGDVTFSLNHATPLSGLTPDTVYFCEITSTNTIGGTTVSSVFSFKTLAVPTPTPTPAPPPATPTPGPGGGGGGAGGGGSGSVVSTLPAPVRIVDTRISSGPIPSGSSRCFGVTGMANIPSDAAAVALNVTAVGYTGPGWLTVYPSGQPVPGTSTLNFDSSEYAIANGTIVPVGSGGQVCVNVGTLNASAGQAQVILDATGFLGASTATEIAMLASPQRVADTRTTRAMILSGQSRCFSIAGVGGVPTDAAAVVLNVTAVGYSSHGWLSVFPSGQPLPATSTLNFDTSEYAVANGSIMRIGTGGQVCVNVGTVNSAPGGAHAILDVTGYLTAAGLTDMPMLAAPQRLVDTRPSGGAIASGQTRCFSVAGQVGIPANASAVVLNVAAVGQAADGWLTAYPGGQPVPPTSTLNFDASEYAIANGAIIAIGSGGQVCLNVGTINAVPGRADVILDVVGYLV